MSQQHVPSHVPSDWRGPVTICQTCGNDAPDVPRSVLATASGPRECSQCFIGRVLNEVVSEQEARALRAEITQEIKKPSTPWKSGAVSNG